MNINFHFFENMLQLFYIFFQQQLTQNENSLLLDIFLQMKIYNKAYESKLCKLQHLLFLSFSDTDLFFQLNCCCSCIRLKKAMNTAYQLCRISCPVLHYPSRLLEQERVHLFSYAFLFNRVGGAKNHLVDSSILELNSHIAFLLV